MFDAKSSRTLMQIVTVPETLVFFRGQSQFMQTQGFEIHVVASPGDILKEFARQEHVEIHSIEMSRRITPLRDLLVLWKLFRTLRKVRPVVVHSHTPKGGLLGMIAAWLAKIPVRIYTIHGLPFMTACGFKRRILRWSEKISCWCAHRVFIVGHCIRDVAVQEGLCLPQKINVLLNGSINGVEGENRFNPASVGQEARRAIREKHGIPQDAVVLGFMGRIVRDKGMIELAEAWRTLREEYPSLHLLLVGPFEPQDPVPQDIAMLFHTDPRIHVVGPVTDTPLYYATMDINVMPSYREGFNISNLEAAAMSLAVVATRIPGCIDAVEDGITGTLVPPRDSRRLADAISAYLADPELRRKHGQAGRRRVLLKFRPEDIWEALYQEYVRLLQQRESVVFEDRKETFTPSSIAISERRAA